IFLNVFLVTSSYSQTPVIDSLKRELRNTRQDKISTLFGLCSHGESMPADSLAKFATMAKKISIENKNLHGQFLSDFYIVESYSYKGMADSALEICNKDLKLINGNEEMFDVYSRLVWSKIIALTKLRKIEESINLCFELLKQADNNNDIFARVTALNNLGVNNNILGNRVEALKWFKEAYSSIPGSSMDSQFPLVFTNLAATYFNTQKYDSAYIFLNKALLIAQQNQNLRSEADCYLLRGLMYSDRNKIDSAEQMLKKAVALQNKIGNIPFTLSFYKDLADCYKQMKNYDAYGEVMDTLMTLKDSLYQKSKADDLAKLEAQYELSSKEAFIAKQQLQLLHKNILITSVALITLLIITIAVFIYRYTRRRQRIALNEAEEKERKRIAADLHDNIGAYASAISYGIDDMENRKLISDAASLQSLKTNAAEIISSLRDTIWAFNKESITITGITDRLRTYIQKIQPLYPGIKISIEENINGNKKLSPVQALHIFRIVQEAIHNAFAHSGGDTVMVNVSFDNGII